MVIKLVLGKPTFLIRLLVSWCWYHTVSCVQGKWKKEKQALGSLLGIFMLCWVQEYLLNSNKFRQEIFNNTGSRKLVENIKITITMNVSERVWHYGWVSSHTVPKLVWFFSSIVLCCRVLFFLLEYFHVFREEKLSLHPVERYFHGIEIWATEKVQSCGQVCSKLSTHRLLFVHSVLPYLPVPACTTQSLQGFSLVQPRTTLWLIFSNRSLSFL